MAIPCMLLEMAADEKAKEPDFDYQQKELTAFGDERAKLVGATGITPDFVAGFELARRCCRLTIKMSPPAAMAGLTGDQMF